MTEIVLNTPASPFAQLRVPEFKSRAPWWGGDLQTMRNQFVGSAKALDCQSRRLEFTLAHGGDDRMSGMLDEPDASRGGPLVLLVHGLTGCEESAYVLESSRFHLAKGRRVLRLNLRGAGPSRSTCGGYYFAGCTEDIRAVIDGIPTDVKSAGVIAVGFSLGGNILLNSLAQPWAQDAFLAAATVCAPIRPAQAASRIMETRNWVYHRFLLQRMKQDTLSPYASLNEAERDAIVASRSIYEFDDIFTAPRNGYADADDYYRRTAGVEFVPDLMTPTLLIHSEDDPWIPVQPYHELCKATLNHAKVVISPGGGHVGFHTRDLDGTWHDMVVDSFISQYYR